MQLGLLVPNLLIGGAERAFVYLANGLAEGGHEVDLIVVDSGGPLRAEVSSRVNVVDLATGSVLRSLPRLVSHLRRRRPEALISTLTYANIVAVVAVKLARSGTRVYVREATTLSRDRGLASPKEWLAVRLARWVYPRANGVIAVSEGVAEDLRTNYGVPGERIRVIYNPAFPNDLERLALEPVDHPWMSDSGVPVVLAVGRLTHAKDYPTLIAAFAAAARRRDMRLIILGDGGLRQRLTKLVADQGLNERVSLPGFAANPYAYMARASVFVLSSEWEGMPNALIQAMACGCPVVSTDCKSGPREVLEGGRYGPLVPVGDAERLAAAILGIVDEPTPRERLLEGAARFSSDRICAEYARYVSGR